MLLTFILPHLISTTNDFNYRICNRFEDPTCPPDAQAFYCYPSNPCAPIAPPCPPIAPPCPAFPDYYPPYHGESIKSLNDSLRKVFNKFEREANDENTAAVVKAFKLLLAEIIERETATGVSVNKGTVTTEADILTNIAMGDAMVSRIITDGVVTSFTKVDTATKASVDREIPLAAAEVERLRALADADLGTYIRDAANPLLTTITDSYNRILSTVKSTTKDETEVVNKLAESTLKNEALRKADAVKAEIKILLTSNNGLFKALLEGTTTDVTSSKESLDKALIKLVDSRIDEGNDIILKVVNNYILQTRYPYPCPSPYPSPYSQFGRRENY